MHRPAARRTLFLTVGAVAVVAVLALALAPQPVAVDLAPVERGPLEVTVDHEGVTRVRDLFEVSAPVAGRLRRIQLEPGDPVRAGKTVLATFQASAPVVLDARSRAEAEARIEAARALLERSRAEREAAQAERDFALAELDRQRGLFARGIVSQQAMDAAETTARARAEQLLAAESAARSAIHDLERATAALIEPSADDRGGTVLSLRSPVDGVVLRRLRESEAVVAAGEPLLHIADVGELEVVADFLSTDAVRIRPGDPARVERWGGDHPIAARVRTVEPAAFMKVSALGVEEQRVWVVLDLVDERSLWASLGDGFRVEARVVLWRGEEVLTVPSSALFRHPDGGWAAYLIGDDHRARLRRVEIDHHTGQAAEVVAGLEAGDEVIVHPPDRVEDGVRVAERAG